MPAYHARIALRAHHTSSGNLIVNVVHAEVDTLSSPPNWSSIATDVDAWLGLAWQRILAAGETFDDITVTDENYPGSTHGQGVVAKGLAGLRTTGNTDLSPALCQTIQWRTAVAKRYGRGHTFLPPGRDTADVLGTSGTWLSTGNYHQRADEFRVAFLGGHTAGSTSYVPEIFSRTKVLNGETPFAFPITSAAISPVQRFLRSRLTTP